MGQLRYSLYRGSAVVLLQIISNLTFDLPYRLNRGPSAPKSASYHESVTPEGVLRCLDQAKRLASPNIPLVGRWDCYVRSESRDSL